MFCATIRLRGETSTRCPSWSNTTNIIGCPAICFSKMAFRGQFGFLSIATYGRLSDLAKVGQKMTHIFFFFRILSVYNSCLGNFCEVYRGRMMDRLGALVAVAVKVIKLVFCLTPHFLSRLFRFGDKQNKTPIKWLQTRLDDRYCVRAE